MALASTSSVSSIVVRRTSIGTLPSSTYTFFCASVTIVRAVQMLDTLMMMHPARKAVQMIPTSLILFSRFLMTIYAYRFFLFDHCIYSSWSIGMTVSSNSVCSLSNSVKKACV